MYTKGELGKIQYLAASHPQDMDGWPDYWEKMIPMHYATHVVSPCLGLLNGRAEYVSCFGSGTVREDIQKKSGNKFAVEIVPHQDQGLRRRRPTSGGSCTTSPGNIARASTSMARRRASNGRWWSTSRTSFTRRRSRSRRSRRKSPCRTYAHLLPEPIRRFTQAAGDSRLAASVLHPGRRPRRLAPAPGERIPFGAGAKTATRGPTPRTSANWTCVGICAHQSALKGGEIVRLPEFTLG